MGDDAIRLAMTAEGIGRRVRQRRQAKRLSQEELATLIGVKRGVVIDMEAGRNVGSHAVIDAIRALDIDEAGVILGDAVDPIRLALVRGWLSAYESEPRLRTVLEGIAGGFVPGQAAPVGTLGPPHDAPLVRAGGTAAPTRIRRGRR